MHKILYASSILLSLALPQTAWANAADDQGYTAGYAWAQDNKVTSARDCGSGNNPFVDGCEAWGNEYEDGLSHAADRHIDDTHDCHGTDAETAGCEAYLDEHPAGDAGTDE